MLISEIVNVKISASNINYYKDLGYNNIKIGDTIETNIKNLSKGSQTHILCTCDYCGKELNITYKDYNRGMNQVIHKIACKHCKGKKLRESNIIKYGVPSPMCLKIIQDKAKETTIKHYGVSNPLQNSEIREKVKTTLLQRYGVEYPSQSSEIREKIRNIVLDKYGVSSVLQSPEVQEKIKRTINLKYGVDYISQSEEIKQKKRETTLKNFGVEYSMQSPIVKEKNRISLLQKYGVEHNSQIEEVKEKIKNTVFRHYGVYHPMQSPIVREKMAKSLYNNQNVNTSSQQIYLNNLYNMTLNYPIEYYNVDMCDINNKLVCEYDGGGHRLSVKFGDITDEEFDKKEIIRNSVIKKAGYKIFRIISREDRLPSDDVLLQILDEAKKFFKNYPNHSWIEFDIDNKCVRNAENKNGVPFDFGETKVFYKN